MVQCEEVEPQLVESVTVMLCQIDDFHGLLDNMDISTAAQFLSEVHKTFHAAVLRNNAFSVQVNEDSILIYPGDLDPC